VVQKQIGNNTVYLCKRSNAPARIMNKKAEFLKIASISYRAHELADSRENNLLYLPSL